MTWSNLLPELLLVLTILGLLLSEATYHGERRRLVFGIALGGLSANIFHQVVLLGLNRGLAPALFFEVSTVTLSFKLLVSSAAWLTIVLAEYSSEVALKRKTEFQIFIFGSVIALDVVLSSLNLIQIFLGVQLYSILAFFIIAYDKRKKATSEAAAKYLIFSVVANAFLAFALALAFSFSGTLEIEKMAKVFAALNPSSDAMLIIFVMLMFVITFFMGLVPSFLWVMDVSNGAAAPAGLWLLATSPIVGVGLFMRVLFPIFGRVFDERWLLVDPEHRFIFVSIISASAVIGALLSLRQTNLKRMVGALGIFHGSVLAAGLLTLSQTTFSTLVFYLWVSIFSLAGLYGVISFLQDECGTQTIEDLRKAANGRSRHTLLLALFLLSFTAFPPSPLFIGRFSLFTSLVEGGHLAAVICLTVGWLITIVSVSRVAFAIFFKPNVDRVKGLTHISIRGGFLYGLTLPLALMTIFSDYVLMWIGSALSLLFA